MSEVSTVSAANIRTDYMQLLIAQLQNQNPLEPVDNTQMATQLAQMSQLEQLENMSSLLQSQSGTFDELLAAQKQSQATDLIGKRIEFFPEASDTVAGDTMASAVVEQVMAVDGQPHLVVKGAVQVIDGQEKVIGDYALGLNAVQSVCNEE